MASLRASRFVQALKSILVVLLAPWLAGQRLAAQQPRPGVLGPGVLAGLLILPSFFAPIALGSLRFLSVNTLPAPQAGLMAALSQGIVGTKWPPFEILLAQIAIWVVLGLLAGLIGGALITGLLLMASMIREAPEIDSPGLWRLASYAFFLIPVGAVAYDGISLHALEPAILPLAIEIVLAAWFLGGMGLVAWGLPHPASPVHLARKLLASLAFSLGSILVVMTGNLIAIGLPRLLFKLMGLP